MSRVPEYDAPRFIAVEGPIRVGKTSLARILADRFRAELVLDVEDNPFLESFYSDQPGAGFQAQAYFLLRRYQQLSALNFSSTARRRVVSDFIFEKDRIFANLNLNDEELALYEQYYALLAEQIPIPDLVIYLQAGAKTLEERIAKKNVRFEGRISEDYLEAVVKAYEHLFFRYQSSNLLVIETSKIDFVERSQDLEQLLKRLDQPVKGTQYYLPLGSVTED